MATPVHRHPCTITTGQRGAETYDARARARARSLGADRVTQVVTLKVQMFHG